LSKDRLAETLVAIESQAPLIGQDRILGDDLVGQHAALIMSAGNSPAVMFRTPGIAIF
jgi:hypothetical protein